MTLRRLLLLLLGVLLAATWTIVGVGAQSTQPEASPSEEAQRQALNTIAAEVTEGNFEVLNQYIADDYVLHSPLGDADRAGLTGLLMALSSALTEFQLVRNHVLVEGNFGTTSTTLSGIFENDFAGPMGVLPPTGEPFALEVINIFRFDDNGKVVEEWAQFDNLSFLTQLGAMAGPAEAASRPVNEEMAADFAERFDAIFDGGNVDIADEIFSPDFVAHLPLAPELDRDGWKAYAASFYDAFPDLTEEVNQVIAGKDRVVLHVTYTGTHEGPLFGIPATGNSVTMDGIGIFSFDENGLATENWAVLDVVGLLAQIGAFPPGE